MKASPQVDIPGPPARRRPSQRTRVILVLAVIFAVWGWVDVRLRGQVDPADEGLHKTDFTVYTEAGAAFFDGRPPYDVVNPRGWKYLYPPLFAMLVAPLHVLPPESQVLVWFALSAWMAWGCYGESVRLARAVLPNQPERGPFGPIESWIGWAAVAASALPALNCLQRGQVAVPKLYFLLLGARLLMESQTAARAFLAGAVLALPIVLKVTPLAPVAILLGMQWVAAWYGTRRDCELPRAAAASMGTLGGLTACLILVPAALVGWSANLEHLDTWWNKVVTRVETTTLDEFAGDSYSARNQSLSNASHRLGNWVHYHLAGGPDDEGPQQLAHGGPGLLMDAPLVDAVLLVARLTATGLVVAVAFRAGRRQDKLGQAAAFGLACVATLVIVPIARASYFVMLLPAILFIVPWLLRENRPRWAQLSAAAPVALVTLHYTLFDLTGPLGLLGLGTTAWYFCMGCAMLRFGQRKTAIAAEPDGAEHQGFEGTCAALVPSARGRVATSA